MTSRISHALDIPFSRLAAFGAGGLGLSLLENKYVGNNLPPELKTVNSGIGLGTGIMLASRDPAMQTAALGSIPLKETALFAVGGMDRFRRQQQALTDTNLQTAKTNLATATTEGHQAAGKRLTELAFLIPAMAAGGALGYGAYDQWKKRHHKPSKFQTLGTSGVRSPSQRVRIDLPPSALPASFYKALGGAEVSPKGFAQLQSKNASTYLAVKKATAGWSSNFQSAHPSLRLLNGEQQQDQHPMLNLAKDMVWQSSGIPALHNAWRDAGSAASSLQDDNYDQAKRYGVAGVGNAALGALALRFGGANVLAKLFGRARLSGVIRNSMAGTSKQLSEMPTFARILNKWGLGHEMGPMHLSPQAPNAVGLARAEDGYISGANRFAHRSAIAAANPESINSKTFNRDPLRRALDMSGRYDPQKYDYARPTSTNPLFRKFLSAGNPADGPRTLPGHLLALPQYGANRLFNAGYAAKQFVKRHPVAVGWTALPAVGGIGTVADDMQHDQDASKPRPWVPDLSSPPPASTNYMPASSIAGNLLGAFGSGSPMSPLQNQFVH